MFHGFHTKARAKRWGNLGTWYRSNTGKENKVYCRELVVGGLLFKALISTKLTNSLKKQRSENILIGNTSHGPALIFQSHLSITGARLMYQICKQSLCELNKVARCRTNFAGQRPLKDTGYFHRALPVHLETF